MTHPPRVTRADGRMAYEAAPERLRQPAKPTHRFVHEYHGEWATTSPRGTIRLWLLCVVGFVALGLALVAAGWA